MDLTYLNRVANLATFNNKMKTYNLHGELPSDTDDEDFVPGENTSSDDSDQKNNKLKKATKRKRRISSEDDEDDDDQKRKRKRTRKTKEAKSKSQHQVKRAGGNSGVLKKRQKKRNPAFGADRASDDPDDSDYDPLNPPGSESRNEQNRKFDEKNTKANTKKNGKLDDTSQQVGIQTMTSGNSTEQWACLPIELLSKVFRLITATESKGVRYILRCGRVCKHWLRVSRNPASYCDIDLSFVGPSLKANKALTLLGKLCKNQLPNVRNLSLSGWTTLTDDGLKRVVKHCKQLEMLNLSSCQKSMSKISGGTLVELAEQCVGLQKMNVANLRFNSYAATWTEFFTVRGEMLTSLNFSNNVAFASATFREMTEKCPHLKVLDCSNTSVRRISVVQFQKSCPLLEELYMANICLEIKDKAKDVESCPGFEHLRLASFATQDFNFWITDTALQSFLKNATKLKTLDIRGAEALRHLETVTKSIESLERLYISNVPINMEIAVTICERWAHSLWDLDISKGKNHQPVVVELVAGSNPCSKLLHMDLSHTNMDSKAVVCLLESLASLETLDLCGCRFLKRGFKKKYMGREMIDKLLVDLQKVITEDGDS